MGNIDRETFLKAIEIVKSYYQQISEDLDSISDVKNKSKERDVKFEISKNINALKK